MSLRVVAEDERIRLTPEFPLCALPFDAAQLEARIGCPLLADPELYGYSYRIVIVDGRPMALGAVDAILERDRYVYVRIDSAWREPEAALRAICDAFGLQRTALPWIADDLAPRAWCLTRLDDDGQRFVMGWYSDPGVAAAVADRYRALGHRQTYTVERAT